MSAPDSRRKSSARNRVLSLAPATPPKGAARIAANGSDAGPGNPVFLDAAKRHALIEQAAYLRAEQRGFEPGHELDDWCDAEREIDQRLFRGEILSP